MPSLLHASTGCLKKEAGLPRVPNSLPYLPCRDKQGEDDGPHSDSKHPVYEETSKEAKDDIGPGVPGVEAHEGALGDVQGLNHGVLEGGRVVIAKVAPCVCNKRIMQGLIYCVNLEDACMSSTSKTTMQYIALSR